MLLSHPSTFPLVFTICICLTMNQRKYCPFINDLLAFLITRHSVSKSIFPQLLHKGRSLLKFHFVTSDEEYVCTVCAHSFLFFRNKTLVSEARAREPARRASKPHVISCRWTRIVGIFYSFKKCHYSAILVVLTRKLLIDVQEEHLVTVRSSLYSIY